MHDGFPHWTQVVPVVKFALFTLRSVRVSVVDVFQRVQSVFRERERGVILWSESSYDT